MAPISRLVLLPLLVCSYTVVAQIEKPASWESALYADHSLVGKIWDSAADSFIDAEQLISAVAGASYILLGEKHDNPDHHDLQRMVLNHLIMQGRVVKVAIEMMDSDSQELLDDLYRQRFANLDELKTYLDWDEEGWDWLFYGPLIQAIYRANIPISAANITNETMGRVYSESTSPEIARVLDADTMQQLNLDIDESHCGLLPESQFPAMVRVQQTRDYEMANNLYSSDPESLAVLIAGNYHVRQDLGVPNYLIAKDSELARGDIVALSFMEVEPGEDEAAAYLQQFGPQRAFDYIWFTPAISDEDYCAALQ